MHKPPEDPGAGAPALERIDATELERLDAARRARDEAEVDQREALEKAWNDEAEYAQAVASLKEREARRAARRRRAAAAAFFVAALALAWVLLESRTGREDVSEAEALRLASEARLRREEEVRAKLAKEGAAGESVEGAATPVPAAAPAPPPKARPAEDAAKPAQKAQAARGKDEERRAAEAAAQAQAQAMVLAEERAKALSAAAVKEAPRAVQRPGTVFQDCADCPRMVVVPAGDFAMGSPAAEAGRGSDEGPARTVAIAQPFALGRSEVTVAEFRRFVEDAGYRTEAERDSRAQGCGGFVYVDPGAAAPPPAVTSWRSPGLAQALADSHPVLCVSWNDARAYAQWLSRKTGKRYRLPSEAEWEYAARAGSGAARFWGDDPAQACRYANVADQSRFQAFGFGQKHECTDGHYFTAPAGGYQPNRFGLYDMIGNVWEWTEDCWSASYAAAPSDGSARVAGECAQRVLRGGSWSTAPAFARSAARHKNAADFRDNLTGFRVARVLE